tara:strand:+ start:44516 stop:44728 length:213 start_codon:yes stop_codon:yes gene_type:complete
MPMSNDFYKSTIFVTNFLKRGKLMKKIKSMQEFYSALINTIDNRDDHNLPSKENKIINGYKKYFNHIAFA